MTISPVKPNIRLLILVVLGLLTIGIYSQVLRHDFVSFDDTVNIQTNPHITRGLSLTEIRWAFTHLYDGNWIPLTWISHMAAVQIFGLHAGGHLLINLILHLLSAFLLLTLLEKLTGKFWPSAFTAALFALHPLHVESVAWVSERKDVLSGLFFILTLHAYTDYVRTFFLSSPNAFVGDPIKNLGFPTKNCGNDNPNESSKSGMTHQNRSYLVALLFFGLGLMAKPMIMTLPVIFFLLDYWPLAKYRHCEESRRDDAAISKQQSEIASPPARNEIMEKIPFFLLSAGSATLTYLAHQSQGWINTTQTVSLKIRIANAGLSAVKYLRKTLWPSDLAVFYPYDAPQSILLYGSLALAALGIITFLAIKFRARFPWLLTGWLWYLVMLAPVIEIISFAGFSMADRYTYLPSIGIYIVIAWSGAALAEKWPQKLPWIRKAATTSIAVASLFTFTQVSYWQNTETLFKHALDVTQNNFIAHENLAELYTKAGDLNRAAFHYENSAMIRPNAATLNNLATTYFRQGKWERAEQIYQSIVKQDPSQALSWNNLGQVYKEKKKFREAGNYFARAITADPKMISAYAGMAEALLEQKRLDEAAALIQRILHQYPNNQDLLKLFEKIKERTDS
ncbi:MAG: tetratricopeptide repeat protein [Candidatus Omnitrophica bacterium]|nr:tetratricopeptide repeat protein [Candidatus Omnitrophota bacterium]